MDVTTDLVSFKNLVADTCLFIRVKTFPTTTVLSRLAEVLSINTLHIVTVTALITT